LNSSISGCHSFCLWMGDFILMGQIPKEREFIPNNREKAWRFRKSAF
jgi:hypothetical protein